MATNKYRRKRREQTLQDLYRKLPHRKNILISKEVTILSPEQVKAVFNGRITDPVKVMLVYKASKKIVAQTKKLAIKRKAA